MMKIMQSEYRGGTGKRVLPKSWVSIIFLHHSASDGEKAYFHDWFFVCLFVCFPGQPIVLNVTFVLH